MHSQGLMRLASRLAGPEDAEDLVQSTYLRAMEHDGSVRARPAWLRQVLVNEQRMHFRSRQRRHAREADVVERGGVDVEEVVHCLEVARIVGTLVDELDEEVRSVVRERYFDGDTAAAIARRHEIPAGTVRWRLKTGLDEMRQRLDAHYGGRRALWAGGFVPLGQPPTLLPGVASQRTAAASQTAAAGKATSVMSVKLLVGIGLVAATAGSAAVLKERADESTEATPPSIEAVAVATPAAKVVAKAVAPPPAATAPTDHVVSEQNHAKILAEHAIAGLPTENTWVSADDDATPPNCEEGECLHACEGEACMTGLASEIAAVMDGCKEFVGEEYPDLAMTAKVIGAPDVGTVVESVDLDHDGGASKAFAECVVEAMYTLELGDAVSDSEESMSVMVKSGARGIDFDSLDLDSFRLRSRADVEAAMGIQGDRDDDSAVDVDSRREARGPE
ncbi:MAG: RNA polymerase sigma factor [Myxococcota bacterium]